MQLGRRVILDTQVSVFSSHVSIGVKQGIYADACRYLNPQVLKTWQRFFVSKWTTYLAVNKLLEQYFSFGEQNHAMDHWDDQLGAYFSQWTSFAVGCRRQ